MPLVIENNYDQVSLGELVRLRERGYSILKSPHVGNQHPSNLVCAALGIPLEMVTFTRGNLDRNFHPHVRIENGQTTPLYDGRTWTQFAQVPHELFRPEEQIRERRRVVSATEYHQSSVRRIFPRTEILTDVERMQMYPALAATVLQATSAIGGLWYRSVGASGNVTKRSLKVIDQTNLETNVFQFSNDQSGWVVPNRVHIIFDLVYQVLSSGRDVVYHLSGPQMVQYVDNLQEDMSRMYDLVRARIPALPLVLKVRVVPVASARFATVRSRADGLGVFAAVRDQLDNPLVAREFIWAFPEFTLPIGSAATLSQYDLTQSDDLVLDPWMVEAPLYEVTNTHNQLIAARQLQAAE